MKECGGAEVSRQYKNPPIREVVCEFRFRPGSNWDLAVPGLIYSDLQSEFPRRLASPTPTVPPIPGIDNPEIQGQIDELLRQDVSRLQGLRFWRAGDEDGVILVAPNRLGISHYRPYPSWERYLPIIQQAYKAFVNQANPQDIQRIGLRYINEVQFSAGRIDLEDYFEIYPHLGKKMPQDFEGLQLTIIIPYQDARDGLRLSLSTITGEDKDKVAIRLDIDYFFAKPGSVALTETSDWLIQAHQNVENIFEGCLKDSVREMFE